MAITAQREEAFLIDPQFPDIGQNPHLHDGRPLLIGTGLTVAQLVRTWQATGGDEGRLVAIHPALAGRQDLVSQALAYSRAYPERVEPDLTATYEEELRRLQALGYEVGAGGKVRRRGGPPVRSTGSRRRPAPERT